MESIAIGIYTENVLVKTVYTEFDFFDKSAIDICVDQVSKLFRVNKKQFVIIAIRLNPISSFYSPS